MTKLFHFLSGYLFIMTENSMPERFLNLCRAKGIHTWGLKNNNGKYSFYIEVSDFKKLKDILKKTGIQLTIVKKVGLPFFMFRYRKHYSFVIGMLLSAFMIYIMSLFVWDISFDGNYIYTDNVLITYLNGNDIEAGMKMKSVDCDQIEKDIRRDFPDITWVSAEISGTRLIIHVKENDGDVIKEEDTQESDIVANRSGTVASIITRNGTPNVKPGDSVEKGTILVSGQIVLYNDSKEPIKCNYVHSDADVYINSVYEYHDELSLLHKYKVYTGQTITKDTYNIFGKQIELGVSLKRFKNYDVVTDDTILKLTDNFYLPIRTGHKVYSEYYTEDGEYTEDEVSDILCENYDLYLKKLQEKGVQIIDSSVKIEMSGDTYVMSGQVNVIEQMNDHVPITPTVEPEKETVSE